ncbi:complex I intermediate-associated protein 30-domain-containing protein [Cladochytrium replicatum]|nr:complex I intermediate-associated protein 30-domain-containing protein [Cladochytrium replicatum]
MAETRPLVLPSNAKAENKSETKLESRAHTMFTLSTFSKVILSIGFASLLSVALLARRSSSTSSQPGVQPSAGSVSRTGEPRSIVKRAHLFGQQNWRENEWKAVDDRVRGGKSQSYVGVTQNSHLRFFGNVDTATLGGAGFASRQITDKVYFTSMALEKYSGLTVTTVAGDGKQYALNLKTTLIPDIPDGGPRSTIEYKHIFSANAAQQETLIQWSQFKPYYRGRPVNETEVAKEVDPASIVTVSLMCQSLFDKQSGPFSVELVAIDAVKVETRTGME